MVHGGGRRGGSGGSRGGSRFGRSSHHRRRHRHGGSGFSFVTSTRRTANPGQGNNNDDNNNNHVPAHMGMDPVLFRRIRLLPLGAFLTSITFTFVLLFSEQREQWTLNAGESRRIIPGLLSRSVQVRRRANSSKDRGVIASLYAIPNNNNCPPLTGPKFSFSDRHSMTLGLQDYQYDYFYLNAGSTLSATLKQISGSSEVLLLRGKAMDLIRGHVTDSDWDAYRRNALASWFTQSGRGNNNREQISYESKHSDTYMLVYDNASNSKGQLEVRYNLELTTYNVQNYTPVCADLKYGCRPIEKKSTGCIILATAPTPKGGGEITLIVTGTRNWFLMVLLSLIPALLLVACEVQRTRKEQQQQGWLLVGDNDDDDGVEVIQSETVRIPATVGSTVTTTTATTEHPLPSAPMESSTIPIAHAQVLHEDDLSGNQPSTALASAPIEIPTDQIEPIDPTKK